MHKLSVLLPNFNNGKYLSECLNSLFNQSYQDFHIYFVDDCSTDNSLSVLSEFPSEKITLIKLEKQSGIVEAMNAGLDKINSEYFIRMDGDDYCDTSRFEKLVGFLDENPDVDICGSAIQAFGIRSDVQKYTSDSNMNKANLLFGHSIGHATCIFRTKLLKSNNIKYVDQFYRLEDYQLFYNLKEIANSTSLPDILYFYRQEAYNYNEVIEQKKLLAYQKFYEMVLSDLFENVDERDVELQMQLAKKKRPTFNLKEYKDFVERLIQANTIKQIYPTKEIGLILNAKLVQIKFLLIDNNKLGFIELMKHGLSDFSLVKHYLKRKFKSK